MVVGENTVKSGTAVKSALLIRVSSAVDKVDHPQFFDPSYQLEYIEAELKAIGLPGAGTSEPLVDGKRNSEQTVAG